MTSALYRKYSNIWCSGSTEKLGWNLPQCRKKIPLSLMMPGKWRLAKRGEQGPMPSIEITHPQTQEFLYYKKTTWGERLKHGKGRSVFLTIFRVRKDYYNTLNQSLVICWRKHNIFKVIHRVKISREFKFRKEIPSQEKWPQWDLTLFTRYYLLRILPSPGPPHQNMTLWGTHSTYIQTMA